MSSDLKTSAIPQALHGALEHLRAGQLSDAEKICQQILRLDPEEPDAHYILGLVAQQSGERDAALHWVEQAVRLQSSNPFFLNSLGEIHYAANDYAQAERYLRRALALDPRFVEAHNNLGNILRAAGKLVDAEQSYRLALTIEPDNSIIHNNLGQVLRDLDRFEEAEKSYRRALELAPGYADAQRGLGTTLLELRKFAEAEQSFRATLALTPDSADAHNGLGIALHELGRSEEAERSYRAALALESDFAEAHNNLGNALKELRRPEEAVKSYCRALALKPGHVKAYINLGLALPLLGRIDDAENNLLEALKLKPGDAEAEFNYSLLRLLHGDYIAGFKYYERRFDRAANANTGFVRTFQARLGNLPRWQGENLKDKRLLLWTEQGFGDSLMMMRYLPRLKNRGADQLTVCCEPALTRLVLSTGAADDVISPAESIHPGAFDCHCPNMSLPLLFQTRLDSIPAEIPYLRVPPEMKRKWVGRLPGGESLKVGLAWAGSRLLQANDRRSIALPHLFPLLDITGPVFVSLQKGDGADQLKKSSRNALDWMHECEDFLETAALVEQLDLVISVDTAVAHLAGALGKPVWLLNRFESEWRWLLEQEYSPWYPTVRIFRQSRLDDWDEVIGRIVPELKNLLKTV